uniref:Internal scaffolding protein n=1 Tax=Dulem virus 194 TaxID=3145671 RepID=A0AAU8B601_9VIRU
MRHKGARLPDFPTLHTNSGSPIHEILEPRFDGRTTKLVVIGTENIQQKYDAEAPLTDINYMLHRLSLGDNSVLTSRQAMYGDFSGLPSDPIEALNLVHQSERAFNRLSLEDRAKYNNDWQRWFADILSGDISRDVSSVEKEVVKDAAEGSASSGPVSV